jgi:hypothetical protein
MTKPGQKSAAKGTPAEQAKAKAMVTDNERMGDLFTEAFGKAAHDPKNGFQVEEFECSAQKDTARKGITMDVRVMGLAGTTSYDQMCKKEKGKATKFAKGSETIKVKLDDDSIAEFQLKDCVNLNSTEYMLQYIL